MTELQMVTLVLKMTLCNDTCYLCYREMGYLQKVFFFPAFRPHGNVVWLVLGQESLCGKPPFSHSYSKDRFGKAPFGQCLNCSLPVWLLHLLLIYYHPSIHPLYICLIKYGVVFKKQCLYYYQYWGETRVSQRGRLWDRRTTHPISGHDYLWGPFAQIQPRTESPSPTHPRLHQYS